MGFKKHNMGCCACTPPGSCTATFTNIGVTYTLCNGRIDLSLYPITVTVTGPEGFSATLQGTDIVYQRHGNFPYYSYSAGASVRVGELGLYVFTVTGPNNFTVETELLVTSLCQPVGKSEDLNIKQYPVYVTGCIGTPLAGANVTLTYPGGSGSGTTGEDGKAILILSAPCLTYSPTVTVVAARWLPFTIEGILVSKCGGNVPLGSWGTPASCYRCCAHCNRPHGNVATVTTPVGTATVKLGEKKKVIKNVMAYRQRAIPPSEPTCAMVYQDEQTLGMVLEDSPVEFFLSWNCEGGVGVEFNVLGPGDNNLSTGMQTYLAKSAYALAAPFTVGVEYHCNNGYSKSTAHGAGVPNDPYNPTTCEPLTFIGHEHPLLTGSLYLDGTYTITETGCDGYGDSGTEDAVQAQSLEPIKPIAPGTVIVQGHANSFTGYGQHTTALAKEIERAGVPVRWVAYDRDDSFIALDPWVAERIINQ